MFNKEFNMLTANTSINDLHFKYIDSDDSSFAVMCMKDILFFAKHCFQYQHPGASTPFFNPHQHQKDLLSLLRQHQYLSISASRGVGITSTLACYYAWMVLSRDDRTYAIISKHDNYELLSDIQDFIEQNPQFGVRVTRNSKHKLTTDNGCHLITTTYDQLHHLRGTCLLYTSPSPRDRTRSRMPTSA